MTTAIAILGLAAFLGWMWYFGTMAGTALADLMHGPAENRP